MVIHENNVAYEWFLMHWQQAVQGRTSDWGQLLHHVVFAHNTSIYEATEEVLFLIGAEKANNCYLFYHCHRRQTG
uniref:Glucosamine--fructose-6-phosphate aminotransferase n=1 Tax=Panagrellus redivivus TaxID=6233 RepID=A0A7E4UWY5_PANRE